MSESRLDEARRLADDVRTFAMAFGMVPHDNAPRFRVLSDERLAQLRGADAALDAFLVAHLDRPAAPAESFPSNICRDLWHDGAATPPAEEGR